MNKPTIKNIIDVIDVYKINLIVRIVLLVIKHLNQVFIMVVNINVLLIVIDYNFIINYKLLTINDNNYLNVDEKTIVNYLIKNKLNVNTYVLVMKLDSLFKEVKVFKIIVN